jgi:branched-chain amino acid transport system ATP-binding protein
MSLTDSAHSELSSSTLSLRSVGRKFGALAALEDLSLELESGERRAIIGTNGAGKTTLFNTITGDFFPTSGRIFLSGVDITNLPPPERINLGLRRTYQTPLLLNELTVAENLYIAVRGVKSGHFSLWKGKHHANEIQQVETLAEKVGVQNLLSKKAREVSHGQRRLVEIAMALVGAPKVLMLDEPAAGLAYGERAELLDLLLDLPNELTVMLIEHDMELALRFAQKISVLHYGKLICEGTPEFVKADKQVHDLYMGKLNA